MEIWKISQGIQNLKFLVRFGYVPLTGKPSSLVCDLLFNEEGIIFGSFVIGQLSAFITDFWPKLNIYLSLFMHGKSLVTNAKKNTIIQIL